MSELTQSRLKQLLHYNPASGVFTRLTRPAQCVQIGDIAGCQTTYGYLVFRCNGKLYFAHRLAFLYMTGKFPLGDTDHIDCVKSNNQWSNLREATRSQNNQNVKILRRNNTSGYRGVSWNKALKKWQARICLHGKEKFLGLYTSPEEAHQAYLTAKMSLYPSI